MTRMPAKPRLPAMTDQCCSSALLLIDVINDFDFEGGEQLLKRAPPVVRALARLVARARAAGIPIIYANDNFGPWRSDFHAMVRHCCRRGAAGRHLVQPLKPELDDYGGFAADRTHDQGRPAQRRVAALDRARSTRTSSLDLNR